MISTQYRLTALAGLLVACGSNIVTIPDDDPDSGGSGGSAGSGAGGLGGTAGLGGVGGTGGLGGSAGMAGAAGEGGVGGSMLTFDCATAPTTAESSQVIVGAKGYHGLAIDGLGRIYGTDVSGSLIRSTYDGMWSPYVSNLYVEQIGFAENNNLYMATYDSVLSLDPMGQVTTLNASPQNANYGLRMGPDGKVWTVDSGSVRRIDINTGVAETVTTWSNFNASAHSLDFNRKFTRLFIGMIGDNVGGQVQYIDLDANYNAVGGPQSYANVGDYAWIDAVAADACGNIYTPNYYSSQLFRITPSGEVSVFVDWSGTFDQYGHGAIFGNGVGGFREDALYLPQPYHNNTVIEVVVGVPSRAFAGVVLNGPTD